MMRCFRFGSYECTVSIVDRARLYVGLDRSAFCVADPNTATYLPEIGTHHTLPSGESAKSWGELERVLAAMLDADLARDSTAVGVGGGVVGDITALAASLYMRGCELVLVPTTLLAMVDASVGGKTGINFGGYKNIVGTFFPAREVRICTDTLATLPEREYRSGLAEAIKTALLGDEELLEMLEHEQERVMQRDPELLARIVWSCVNVKGTIVEADLKESGIRAHLNLGHTFAHALESVEGLGAWSHGEAVAWGMSRAMRLGVVVGVTPEEYAKRVRSLLARYGYRIDPVPDVADAVLRAMRKDKKRRGEAIRFVLQEELGRTSLREVDASLVMSVLSEEPTTGD
jgi:3-dehydroquinate synthase